LIGHWAVFNLADICITTGVALFAVYALFYDKPQAKPAGQSA
jgi:lipoprotein signal peptidase